MLCHFEALRFAWMNFWSQSAAPVPVNVEQAGKWYEGYVRRMHDHHHTASHSESEVKEGGRGFRLFAHA